MWASNLVAHEASSFLHIFCFCVRWVFVAEFGDPLGTPNNMGPFLCSRYNSQRIGLPCFSPPYATVFIMRHSCAIFEKVYLSFNSFNKNAVLQTCNSIVHLLFFCHSQYCQDSFLGFWQVVRNKLGLAEFAMFGPNSFCVIGWNKIFDECSIKLILNSRYNSGRIQIEPPYRGALS